MIPYASYLGCYVLSRENLLTFASVLSQTIFYNDYHSSYCSKLWEFSKDIGALSINLFALFFGKENRVPNLPDQTLYVIKFVLHSCNYIIKSF